MEATFRRRNILYLRGIYIDDLKSTDDIFDRKFTSNDAAPVSKVIYQSIPEHFTNLTNWPKTTNLKCWQCDCTFNSIPVFVPTDMYHNRRGELVFDTHGNFCTFNCAQRYINLHYKGDPMKYDRDRALRILYKQYTGKKIDHIVPAPDKTQMQQYRGEHGISYKEFRDKIYELNNDYELTVYKFDHFNTTL
jgi:hypothetical protein